MNDLSERFVPGDGPASCDVMVIGEAPGADEDRELRPFVGRAGRVLNEALAEVGLPRESVYITNVVKRRPPNNRPPTPEEIESHLDYLIGEIQCMRPRFVLLLGNTALSTLTEYEGRIMSRRGRISNTKTVFPSDTIVYATLHPSAVLHNSGLRQSFLEDLSVFANLVHQVRTNSSSGPDTNRGENKSGE